MGRILLLSITAGVLTAQGPGALPVSPGAAPARPAHTAGLTIVPTFDSTITTDPHAAEIESTVDAAIAVYQSLFSDPVTVAIYFRASTVRPAGTVPVAGAAPAYAAATYDVAWADYIAALKADAKSGHDGVALRNLPAVPLAPSVTMTSSNARALGLDRPGFLSSSSSTFSTTSSSAVPPSGAGSTGGIFDGVITLDTGALSLAPMEAARQVGAVPAGQLDNDPVRVLVRAIGLILGLRPAVPPGIAPVDLVRYSAPGTLSVAAADPAKSYFSIDGGVNPIDAPLPLPSLAVPGAVPGADFPALLPEAAVLDVIGYDPPAAAPSLATLVGPAIRTRPVIEPEGAPVSSAPGAPRTLSQNVAGLKINVTYGATVPAAAQTAFNTVKTVYENLFRNSVTVNLIVNFGTTNLGQSQTAQVGVTYAAWRTAVIANATANPGNTYAAAAVASLPVADPLASGTVWITTANARALGLSAATATDSTLTFSDAATWSYNGAAVTGANDFPGVAAHELDEALGIGSQLTGLANNSALPTDGFAPEDYFRYSAAGTRAVNTNPNAVVYFSWNGGAANVAQFNQDDNNGDRNDWAFVACPAASPHVQDAVGCDGQVSAVGTAPETIVLNTLGYNQISAQTITFNALSSLVFGAAPFTVSATASSGLIVTFASTTTGVCTVSGSTVTIVAAGTCSLTASQAGDASYSAAASVTQSFAVNKGSQTITFGSLPNVTLAAAPFTVAATASSGLVVSLASSTGAVCTVSGITVTLVAVGTCSLTASQVGNTNYNAAGAVTQTFVIAGTNLITFPALSAVTFGIAPFGLTATSSSGLAVSFVSTTAPVCTVSGSTVTVVGAGTCSITASQAGNANFAAAPVVVQSFTVNKATQTVTFGAPASQVFGGGALNVAATAGSGLAVSFASTTASVCSVTGTSVSLLAAGTCSLTASQAGNGNYLAATPVTQSFTIAQASQSITFGALVNAALGGAPFGLTATASSGLTVGFTSTTTSVCTVSGTTVTLVAAGTCGITASQAGGANFAAAPSVSQSFTVSTSAPSVALSVGGGIGVPGRTVEIAIQLASTGGALPAGFQADLSFDQTKLTFASARAGARLTDVARSLSTNTLGNGDVRFLATGASQNSIADGIVAYATFNVNAGFTSGTTAVTPKNCGSTDGAANSLSTACTAGTVKAASCDINGDANTNVADVQLIINEALGQAAAVHDLNGDGQVNVADVQKVINAALGLGCILP